MPPKEFKLTHYVITLIGCEFGTTIKSDARWVIWTILFQLCEPIEPLKKKLYKSYECTMDLNGVATPAVQHSWITKQEANLENKFLIEGILDTAIYQ